MPMLLGDRELKAGMLVFVGAKKVLFRPWERDAPKKALGAPRRAAPGDSEDRRPLPPALDPGFVAASDALDHHKHPLTREHLRAPHPRA
jgi:hypothetical protein